MNETEVVTCHATTKKGSPCKNRPMENGTLCKLHDKLLVEELKASNAAFKSMAIGKSHKRYDEVQLKLAEIRKDLDPDELAQSIWAKASNSPPPADMQPEIICISGSRDVEPHRGRIEGALVHLLTHLYPRPYILVGDAKGTDRIVADTCKTLGYEVEVVKAQWETGRGQFRPQAGMERNELMIRRASTLVAFNHEGYGEGDSGFQATDKGTNQAIGFARATKKKVIVFNMTKWDAEEAELTEKIESEAYNEIQDEAAQYAELHQLIKADQFKYQPSLLALNTSSWIYIGVGKQGTAMCHPGMLAMPRGMDDPAFKRKLWQRMTSRDPHLLRELARINDQTSIVCDCYVSSMHEDGSPDHYCHGHIVIAAKNFLNSNDGEQYRMTSQEIKDYDAVHHPALLATRSYPNRCKIVARYGQMIQKVTPKPQPRDMNANGKKLSKATPLVKGSKVIFINGDIELPAIITHIEYGPDWIEDQYTGRRRKEIFNCLLFNEPTKAHFVYSDSNAEMIRRGHRNNEDGMPAESGLLPTIAPYIRKVRPVKEITLTDLTTNCRIKSGMPIRILDRTTGAVMDVGIAKTIQSAMWYMKVPQAPAIKDAWIVEYLSLLTNKPATWKGDEGTRIEAAY